MPYLRVLAKGFTQFLAQITCYRIFTTLHELILTILQMTNQIKQRFPAKSRGGTAIFKKLLWGRGWV